MPWRRTVPRRILWQHSFRPISSARRVYGPGSQWPRYFSLQPSACAALKDRSDSLEDWTPFRTQGETSMSTALTTERITETSPQVYARIGGVLYLIIIVIGFCSEFLVRDKLAVSGDVADTANNIAASESLWRISIAGELILLVCAVALNLILYVLLRPVNKNLALLAVLFNMVEFPLEALSKLCRFAALFLSGNADYLKAFEPHQLHALVN